MDCKRMMQKKLSLLTLLLSEISHEKLTWYTHGTLCRHNGIDISFSNCYGEPVCDSFLNSVALLNVKKPECPQAPWLFLRSAYTKILALMIN